MVLWASFCCKEASFIILLLRLGLVGRGGLVGGLVLGLGLGLVLVLVIGLA